MDVRNLVILTTVYAEKTNVLVHPTVGAVIIAKTIKYIRSVNLAHPTSPTSPLSLASAASQSPASPSKPNSLASLLSHPASLGSLSSHTGSLNSPASSKSKTRPSRNSVSVKEVVMAMHVDVRNVKHTADRAASAVITVKTINKNSNTQPARVRTKHNTEKRESNKNYNVKC